MGLGFEPPAEPDTLKHSAKPTEAKMTNRLHDTEKATLKLMRTYSSTIAAANQKPKPKPVRTPLARHSESKYEQFKKSCMSLPPIKALAVVTQSGRVSRPPLADTTHISRPSVTTLSLGVETAGGRFTPIIECNTPLPTRATKSFTTFADNQPGLSIEVYEGERPMVSFS